MGTSLVTVTFHSSSLLPALLASLEGVDEVVVVDHSEAPEEAARLRAAGAEQVIEAPNRGYGAGLNTGVAATSGEYLVLCNPDLVFRPGALPRLIETARQPAVGVVGPRYVWDGSDRWLLPYPEPMTWRDELLWRVAPRRAARRSQLRQRRVWTAIEPIRVPVVIGAVMVMRREVFEAVGGLDERFFLFFEENALCHRLASLDLASLLEPRAMVEHHFGHSIGDADATHHGTSHRIFRRLHMPGWYRLLFAEPPGRADLGPPPPGPSPEPGEILVIATEPSFVPIAGCRWRQADDDPATLLPPHAGDEPYHAGVLRAGGTCYLGQIRRRAASIPIAISSTTARQ
jgi:N-acetylglucosaminyl-diphospho-decaprenol L-rhamnosyltransferase